MTSHASRIKINVKLLNDSNRIREDYSHVKDLAESIKERGLIQPIVITVDNTVIDGGSRLRACRDILGYTEVDVVYMENMSEAELRILEVEANVRRKDFSWQERIIAVARVHELKAATAALTGDDRWTQKQTAELLNIAVGNVNNCLVVAKCIRAKDKDIVACGNFSEALKLLLERKENELTKRLSALTTQPTAQIDALNVNLDMAAARRNIEAMIKKNEADDAAFYANIPTNTLASPSEYDEAPQLGGAGEPSAPAITIPLSKFLLQGDCIEHMAGMPPESIDHIITDIPYGIEMSNLQQQNTGMDVSATAAEHDVEQNISLMFSFIPAAFRVLKTGGFCVFWYDLDHHEKLQQMAVKVGFTVQRWPLVWVKTHTCLNQSAQYNFTKATEVCMVLRKGNATLLNPQPINYFLGGNDDTRAALGHPFVKPFKLWSWLFTAIAMRGQTVYDPFAGVGSSTIAAVNHGLQPIASELNAEHYNRLVLHTANAYRTLHPSAVFA